MTDGRHSDVGKIERIRVHTQHTPCPSDRGPRTVEGESESRKAGVGIDGGGNIAGITGVGSTGAEQDVVWWMIANEVKDEYADEGMMKMDGEVSMGTGCRRVCV